MTIYVDNFASWADVCDSFFPEVYIYNAEDDSYNYKPDANAPKEPTEVIFAGYTHEGYTGDAFVLYRQGRNKYYVVDGSHCSCYGLEGQWDPTEYIGKKLIIEVIKKRDDSWGMFGAHKDVILSALNNPKQKKSNATH